MTEQDRILALRYLQWKADWNLFAYEVFGVHLDKEQRKILESIQHNPRTSIMSGTARGKDYVMAVACLCFLYLTPKIIDGKLIENTKVAMTAPTGRQIENIMFPEISRLFRGAKIPLVGRLVGNDIRTPFEEYFLTGFKADDTNTEAWTGFHASNVMFAVTEASGISEAVFEAIEGNLQGNSRLALAFNPNVSIGYAARSQKARGWTKFRLDDLDSINVKEKRMLISGQVDYQWVKDKIDNAGWCEPISEADKLLEKGDFEWENRWYRPNDTFRIKVRGMFPEVSESVLVPLSWAEAAVERWYQFRAEKRLIHDPLRLGVDVAGMGTDNTCYCHRYGHFVERFTNHNSGGTADHMKTTGEVKAILDVNINGFAFIDTIGEGAGVYSRLQEQGIKQAISCKFSESAKDRNGNPLTDYTGVNTFPVMRDYLFWAIRDALNPETNRDFCLPDVPELIEELTEIKWGRMSDGRIKIEPKEEIKKRLKRSPDYADSLANSFYPDDKIQDFDSINIYDLVGIL